MGIRRRGMIGAIPANMAVDEITVSQLAEEHTFSHSLGQTPDLFFLIAKTQSGYGNASPIFFDGVYKSTSSSYSGMKKMISNYYLSTTQEWDYSANGYGYDSNNQSIQIKMTSSTRLPVGSYYLITYKFS